MEAQLKTSREATVNQKRLPGLDFEGKLLALDMLGTTV
jgi:hypothetical protein